MVVVPRSPSINHSSSLFGLVEGHLPCPGQVDCVVLALGHINADEDVNTVAIIDHECSVISDHPYQ